MTTNHPFRVGDRLNPGTVENATVVAVTTHTVTLRFDDGSESTYADQKALDLALECEWL